MRTRKIRHFPTTRSLPTDRTNTLGWSEERGSRHDTVVGATLVNVVVREGSYGVPSEYFGLFRPLIEVTRHSFLEDLISYYSVSKDDCGPSFSSLGSNKRVLGK